MGEAMYELNSSLTLAPDPFTATENWPREVELILSALESGQHPRADRRAVRRATYRSQARLRLFSDKHEAPPWLLYTRDVCGRGLGFITPHYLPLGYGGILTLQMPDGEPGQMQCTLSRCRQVSPGWYEGALNFSRVQAEFAKLVT
jgi:hypothetical protein